MEVVIVPDAKSGGELIAEAMAQLLRRKPAALLGVATGSTPLPGAALLWPLVLGRWLRIGRRWVRGA